jgi:hypothetical protein
MEPFIDYCRKKASLHYSQLGDLNENEEVGLMQKQLVDTFQDTRKTLESQSED